MLSISISFYQLVFCFVQEYQLMYSLFIILMPQQESVSNQISAVQIQSHSAKNKIFNFQYGEIQYCNVEQALTKENQSNQLVVHNFLCYQQGDKLVKITQIFVQEKLLRIKDELKIVSQVNQVEREQKKSLGVFRRRNNYTDPKKNEKCDTKNLIKNIINLFTNWLRIRNTQLACQVNKKLKAILKKMKYFNKLLIQQMCKDREICVSFLQFSETDSQTAIENSRIKDKDCHFKAMKNYSKLFEESKNKIEKDCERNNSVSTNQL